MLLDLFILFYFWKLFSKCLIQIGEASFAAVATRYNWINECSRLFDDYGMSRFLVFCVCLPVLDFDMMMIARMSGQKTKWSTGQSQIKFKYTRSTSM